MAQRPEFIVGTSGYSFKDWVGTFYPADTPPREMFARYVGHFDTVELNFTYYRMPTAKTLEALARNSPPEFTFWVKANRKLTHEHDPSACGEFLENLQPLRSWGKLAGVLCQFPQSFHRTLDNRRYLGGLLERLRGDPLAVEFRHRSWDTAATVEGLRERDATLVIPDAPPIDALYRPEPTATTRTGYLRLHSRDASKWYDGAVARYDYSYNPAELDEILARWSSLSVPVDRVFAFFNNCHGGQAAHNAEAFRRILAQIP